MKDGTNASNTTASPPEAKVISAAMEGNGRPGEDRAGPYGRDEAKDAPSLDSKRLADVRILGGTMIFYSVLQTALQYLNEFHVDDLRDASGLDHPRNFPAVSLVVANVFNGVNGGLALATAVVSGRLIHRAWSGGDESKCARWFFASFCVEALVTSGVMHSVAHRLFGATLDGNAFVEFFSHVGYTINVIVTSTLLVGWLAPSRLGAGEGSPPGWRPRPIEIALAVAAAILAIFFTQRWVPYEPDPADFDYDEDHEYNETRIVFLQRNVQGVLEGALLVPTVLLLFVLRRLWGSLRSSSLTTEDGETRLATNTFRWCILSVALPLCLNWIHFRCHDDLVRYIQPAFGWTHSETIAAIRMVFHIPTWVLAVARTHHFRLLAEERAGWPPLDVLETLCPGREVFPFVMVFLYRATEGMTLALLPTFFSGEERGEDNHYFYLDITDVRGLHISLG